MPYNLLPRVVISDSSIPASINAALALASSRRQISYSRLSTLATSSVLTSLPRSVRSNREALARRTNGATVALIAPPPIGAKPACTHSISTCMPSLASSGTKACCKKSVVGANGLCVPPMMVTVDLLLESALAKSRAGSSVCSTRLVLPAEPISKA